MVVRGFRTPVQSLATQIERGFEAKTQHLHKGLLLHSYLRVEANTILLTYGTKLAVSASGSVGS